MASKQLPGRRLWPPTQESELGCTASFGFRPHLGAQGGCHSLGVLTWCFLPSVWPRGSSWALSLADQVYRGCCPSGLGDVSQWGHDGHRTLHQPSPPV